MSKRREPGWRNRAASELLVGQIPGREMEGSALVMEDTLPDVEGALGARGLAVSRWNRRALGGLAATPWPPAGPFHLAALRLPRSKEELAMALHAAASVLCPGAAMLVYGAKDEGIQSALDLLAGIFDQAETLAVGGHSRVLTAIRKDDLGEVRGTLESWRTVVDPGYRELGQAWISYPGIFSHRHLDPGTRLLLDALPPLPPGSRILDYGCGSGAVGAVAGARGEGLRLELLDVDVLALEAARENAQDATLLLSDGLPGEGAGPYDAILSNPPFHRGKDADPEMIRGLIRSAPNLLAPKGVLVFVTQRRMPVERTLKENFREAKLLAEDSSYGVWQGRAPR